MKKRKSWFEILLVGSIVIVVLVVAAYAMVSTRCAGRMQSEMDKIRAKGEPVTVRDLAREPIPDQVNAAFIYKRAFALMDASPYKEDVSTIESFSDRSTRRKDPHLWDDAVAPVERSRPIVDILNTAANQPLCQFPVKWEDGFMASMEHLTRLRKAARLQAAVALLAAKRGDTDAAVGAVDTGLKMSETIEDERILISLLVRVAMLNTSLRSLQDSAEMTSMTETQARRIDSTLSQIDLRDAFANAMLGERAMGNRAYDEVREKGPACFEGLTGLGASRLGDVPTFIATRRIGRPLLNADQAYYIRYMNGLIEMARKPYYQVAGEINNSTTGLPSIPDYAPVARILCPVLSRSRQYSETCIANIAVTRTGLGLVAYKERYGSYPQTLAELKSKLGWELPKDPFSDMGLKYKRTAKGFVVYSIGSNLVDDGGKEPDPKSNDPYDADVVWKMEH